MAAESWLWRQFQTGFQNSGIPDISDDDMDRIASRRTSSVTEPSSYQNDDISSDDDVDFSSLAGEDALDSLDYRTIQFVDRYLNSEGRRSRSSKRTKDTKEAYSRQNKPAAQKARASGSRRQSRDQTQQSLENMNEESQLLESGEIGNENQTKADINKRKRSVNILRTVERDAKFDISITSTLESPDANASATLPLQSSVKIDTTNHFRSLNSKPMVPKEHDENSGALTPIKLLSQECSRERQDFYRTFSLLIRMGNSEPKIKEENYNFVRQVRAPPEPELHVRSHEDQVWQNKLNDLVWLELRAWHNGNTIQAEDQSLCLERERIGIVLEEVMQFKFFPSTTECCFYLPTSSDELEPRLLLGDVNANDKIDYVPFGGTRLSKTSRPKLNLSISKTTISAKANKLPVGNSSPNTWDPGYSCCGFCSIFCRNCLATQNDALSRVKELLDKLDSVESLYPSSRAMKKDWGLYTTTEFDNRFRTLCLFYNLVTDLRQKISSLGKMLASLGGKNLPWPTFRSTDNVPDDYQPETPEASQTTDISFLDTSDSSETSCNSANRERKLSKSVQFTGDLTGNNFENLTPSNSTLQNVINNKDRDRTSDSGNCTPTPAQTINSPIFCKSPFFPNSLLNRSFSELSEGSFMSPYRRYVDKLLKQKGLRKLLSRLMELVHNTLIRSKFALERPPNTPMVTSPDLPKFGEESPMLTTVRVDSETTYMPPGAELWSEELSSYGSWSEDYRNMSLPSFRALYLFLLKIPLEIMHECLQLRLEQQPEEPSALSIRQLMRECKEAIKGGVIVRQKHVRMNRAVLLKSELESMEQELTDYDNHVKQMLQCYLRYLQSCVQMLIKSTQQTQKNVLEEEWMFVKIYSRYVQRGEALASEMFCSMASNMLDSTGDFLETGLDRCTSEHDRLLLDQDIASSTRHNILQSCRDFKEVFQETRKRALKAIAFAKMLRKDLEIASEFRIATSDDELLQKLHETGHIRLIAPHSSSFAVFIPGHIKSNLPYLWELLSMTYGHEHSAAPDNVESEGYLIIWSCQSKCSAVPSHWKGPSVVIEPTAEITITLSHLKVEGLILVVNHSSQLGSQRKAFEKALGETVSMTKEFTSCNQSIADSLMDLKKEAIGLREKIKEAICLVEERLDVGCISDLDDLEKSNLQARCREILHQCYKFGFEYHKEMTRLVTGEYRCVLGNCLISFAKQWMNFVAERCERGRGVRPRWASKGLDFLMTACEPQYLKQLTEEEFSSLKQTMNNCIQHLIGSPVDSRTNTSGLPGSRSHSPSPHSRPGSFRHSASYGDDSLNRYPRSVSVTSSRSEPATMSTSFLHPSAAEELVHNDDGFLPERRKSREENLDDLSAPSESESPMERIHSALQKLENNREEKLRQNNMIGCVLGKTSETTVQISARRVTFHWQRGIKLGQGRFGKVYTAVNNDTGDLMALKEIHLQPNDHKTIKEVADELKIFEGIRHPYLVRYFGVEIHRDEMFIFMEYCNCGTLESESAAQLGFPEPQIRKYTRQLLEATSVLHENGIVHRDIKGANIFLTSDGNLKLGDFGCCIKLKNHSTMPGEVNSFVGTQAYMAPEVFTKSESGRAADIWSLGCVVVEMATGMRPWPELENNYQIMFKVGIGETPRIPDNLSDEGNDFLNHCFQFEPRERWTAVLLLDHPFTKVDTEDEFLSITFLPDLRHFH